MDVIVTKLQLRLVQRREKVGNHRFKVHGVTSPAPVKTTRQSS